MAQNDILYFGGHENTPSRCFSLNPMAVLFLFIAALHQRSKAFRAMLITLPCLPRRHGYLGQNG